MKTINEYLTETYIKSYKLLKEYDFKNLYPNDLEFNKNLAHYVENFPEPKILYFFFREYGFLHSFDYFMFDHSQIEHIASCISFLKQNDMESEISNLLIELKKYYSRLIDSKKNKKLEKFKTSQIKEIIKEPNKPYEYKPPYVNIYKSLFELCIHEFACANGYESFITKKQLASIFESRKIEIEDILSYIDNEIQLLKSQPKKNNILENQSPPEKLTWLKNKQDLVYLLENLEELGYIGYNKNKNILIETHFNVLNSKTKNIEIFKAESVKHIRSKIKNPNSTINAGDSIKIIVDKFKNKSKDVN